MSGGSSRMYFGRPCKAIFNFFLFLVTHERYWTSFIGVLKMFLVFPIMTMTMKTWPQMNWESSSLKLFEFRLTRSQEPALMSMVMSMLMVMLCKWWCQCWCQYWWLCYVNVDSILSKKFKSTMAMLELMMMFMLAMMFALTILFCW